MKGGKVAAKSMGPMFPRLHVNDTDKGGPRAPPRNKMSLYEQLSIPSNKFISATLLPVKPGSGVPSVSSAQMDGFDQTVNVKVIMATNRADTLDPALIRPGRLDRKIEFPLPDRRQKRLVFQVCTAKMNLSDEVDLEDYVSRPDRISAAEIAAICQEAGMHAVRKNRYVILPKDFEKGYRTNVKKPDTDFDFYK